MRWTGVPWEVRDPPPRLMGPQPRISKNLAVIPGTCCWLVLSTRPSPPHARRITTRVESDELLRSTTSSPPTTRDRRGGGRSVPRKPLAGGGRRAATLRATRGCRFMQRVTEYPGPRNVHAPGERASHQPAPRWRTGACARGGGTPVGTGTPRAALRVPSSIPKNSAGNFFGRLVGTCCQLPNGEPLPGACTHIARLGR